MRRYLYIDKYGYGSPFVHVHPLRQKHVKHLTEHLPEGTRYAFLFGSALFPSCRSDSDIDVALIGEINKSDSFMPMKLPDCEYDIFIFSSMDELRKGASRSIQNAERSILDEGLLIYGGE
ncbi:MAG: nucleotidyltransferase domain-containing protein [Clostridiales bacterium]|jgi:hypothetical protein|nr:nucleotidyltransferase domain-containing protein [Clostridiales bacterium]